MLSLFISASLIHGYLPCSFMTYVIVPDIKDKNKRISDKNNYRPIYLSNVITKVLERVLHTRIDVYMGTMHKQLGFKSKLGTYMCVYVLK